MLPAFWRAKHTKDVKKFYNSKELAEITIVRSPNGKLANKLCRFSYTVTVKDRGMLQAKHKTTSLLKARAIAEDEMFAWKLKEERYIDANNKIGKR
jgi:hypothetical protein